MVVDPADGLHAALLGDAGVAAFLPDTCKVHWALRVRGAFRPGWFSNGGADLIRIALISRWADACRLVISNLTQGIDSTLVVIDAWVLAFLADTCKSAGAIFINRALGSALNKGIAL